MSSNESMRSGTEHGFRRTSRASSWYAAVFDAASQVPVAGVYIPLGSFVFERDVWRGEPDRFFYGAFFIALAVYSGVLYGFWRLALLVRAFADPARAVERSRVAKEQTTWVVPEHETPDQN